MGCDGCGACGTRREFLWTTAALLAGAGAWGSASAPRVQRDGQRVWLTGTAPYGVREPMFEAARLALRARGEVWSAGYVQGLSGAAFRLAGICPCAPTCNGAMGELELVQLLGYEAERLPLDGKGEVQQRRFAVALAHIRSEIDAGRPVPVWSAFTTAEWDLVCGYDDATHQLLGYGSYRGSPTQLAMAPAQRILNDEVCPPLGVLRVGARRGALPAAEAEAAALHEAVRHGRSRHNVERDGGATWVMLEGLACYDRWVGSFATPGRKLGSGDSYCRSVYSSTHGTAAEFLELTAQRWPAPAVAHLRRAAACFRSEAGHLGAAGRLITWGCPEVDAARDAQAAVVLGSARDSYAAAIDAIEAALAWIPAPGPRARPRTRSYC